ncbi:MAG TPA: signal recognition particle receptor subunit alpha, partial [Gaiellaceae bacterium]
MLDSLSDRLQGILGDLRKRGTLDEEAISRAMREIRLALLEADVNFNVVRQFVAQVRERALGQDVLKSLTPGQQVVKIVHEELTALMGAGASGLAFAPRAPTVILLAGLQGSGKTTAAAKLALFLRK